MKKRQAREGLTMAKRTGFSKYQREDFRRDVSYRDLFLYFYFSLPAFLLSLGAALACVFLIPSLPLRIMSTVLFLIAAYIFLKRSLMGAILMYKAYAPLSVRDRCRYTPTCSTYALISVARYGIVLGGILGILRITRCRPPYGGKDQPSLRALSPFFKK